MYRTIHLKCHIERQRLKIAFSPTKDDVYYHERAESRTQKKEEHAKSSAVSWI